jgi:hypothetical protein
MAAIADDAVNVEDSLLIEIWSFASITRRTPLHTDTLSPAFTVTAHLFAFGGGKFFHRSIFRSNKRSIHGRQANPPQDLVYTEHLFCEHDDEYGGNFRSVIHSPLSLCPHSSQMFYYKISLILLCIPSFSSFFPFLSRRRTSFCVLIPFRPQ